MGDKLDMALDDIIKTTKGAKRGGSGGGQRRGGGGRRGGGFRGGPRNQRRGGMRNMSNGANRSGMTARRWNHDMFQGGPAPRSAPPPLMSGSVKLNIGNLEFAVSDSDIRELFQEFGELKSAAIHYDRAGRSLGSAHVIFSRYSDAQKAVKQYDGVHLDGRPMKISIEGGMKSSGGPRPLLKRLNPGRQMSGGGNRGGRRNSGGRGRSGGARGGKKGGEKAKPKTAEELDAELDSYVSESKKSTSTVTPVTAPAKDSDTKADVE